MPSRPIRPRRRRRTAALTLAGVAALAGGVAGCGSRTASPGGSTGGLTPSATASAAPLTDPGRARAAVRALEDAAGTHDVVKLDISADRAALSIVRNTQPLTWAWTNGVVAPATSDIANVHQASFDPDSFDLDDVGSLFSRAAVIAHSTSNQQLQIVEYNQQQVLMTVTTNPESVPVFFRADGSLVSTLNFGSTNGIAEGLRDCLDGATSVAAIGYRPDTGLYVQVPGQQGGTLDQTTRPANLPRWSTTIKGTAHPGFDPALVHPDVVASILGRLRTPTPSASGAATATSSGTATPAASDDARPSGTAQGSSVTPASPSAAATSASATPSAGSTASVQPDITWVIDRRDTFAHQPVMRFSVAGQERDFLLDGTEVTALYQGS